jgi:hypothetical protein
MSDDDIATGFLGSLHALFLLACEGQSLTLGGDPEDVPDSPDEIAFEAVMFCVARRVVTPDWAADRVSAAWKRFQQFEHASIGEAFGIPHHRHREALRGKRHAFAMYCRVIELQDQGIPLWPDSTGHDGALHQVATEFKARLGLEKLSEYTVRDRITQWKQLCDAAGKDAEADARATLQTRGGISVAPRLFRVMAEALSPQQGTANDAE